MKEQVFLVRSRISDSDRGPACFGTVLQERSVLQTGRLPNVATGDASESPFVRGSVSSP